VAKIISEKQRIINKSGMALGSGVKIMAAKPAAMAIMAASAASA